EYAFPRVTLEPRIGDVVEFRLKVLNSYDASNAFRALMGGRRRLCLNGLVGREHHTLVYARHTTGFSSERAVEGIRRAMERYLSLDAEWKRWAERDITAETVREVFEAMPEINPKRLAYLSEAWETEAALAGTTVWALYNALTRNADSLIMPRGSLVPQSSLVEEMVSFGIKLRPGLLFHFAPGGYFCSFIACSTRRSNAHENVQIEQHRWRGRDLQPPPRRLSGAVPKTVTESVL
ncbi:MAG: DUF932 domain-containing protein, partial [Methyloceanibacter sp.]